MLFSSHIFLFLFLPFTLGGFCLLARHAGPKPAKGLLTLASLVFYGWWNPICTLLILASMLVNFSLGRRIGAEVRAGRPGMGWLTFAVTANLLLLGYCKYANFFVNNANALLGTHWSLGQIVLPLGISFFTFTQIAYLVDVRRGVVCEYDLGDFLLFITFFPHLIAGPIIHHREMMPQFREPKTYRFNWDNLAVGLAVFAVGLFKKTVLADQLGASAGKIFEAGSLAAPMHANDAWIGALSYTFQLYFDFSGYSDMAIGLARMFGIVLPLNFNSPYKAVNISEFWHRWHMTLSRFLRDYLYIPLGGNRRGEFRRHANLMLTMFIGGFWHGAAWTFALWGLFHGACLAVNHLWHSFRKGRARPALLPAWLTAPAAQAFTFLLVVIGWVLFRAPDMHGARHVLGAMFGWGAAVAPGTPHLLKSSLWPRLAGLLAFVWLLPNTAEIFCRHQPYPGTVKAESAAEGRWFHWNMGTVRACLCALMFGLAILALSKSGEFLYYNF
jgi:D-alanyl-lipoteichoic acid acyltransferase DltB (MBOAT superfamily)